MRDTSGRLSTGVIGLSAALLLLLAACGEPAEEEQGAVEAPATEQAPATDTEPAEGETTQQ
jgi:hypothetical protein